jgi:hypothetical protein
MASDIALVGSSDPEQVAYCHLLMAAGIPVAFATIAGRKVSPGEAYRADGADAPIPPGSRVLRIECDAAPGTPLADTLSACEVVVVDHHRPGDPGHGRAPEDFLAASSLGQVISLLAREKRIPVEWLSLPWMITGMPGDFIPPFSAPGMDDPDWWVYISPNEIVKVPLDLVLTAAADHCLSAAYKGACPGVAPNALMLWRVVSRASFQKRPAREVIADIEAAREALREAPSLSFDGDVCAVDMRGRHVPELPEASAREGLCFVADGLPGPDGRVKVVCQSGSPEQIRAFMQTWAPAQGLTNIYGDPERGFAGGYYTN